MNTAREIMRKLAWTFLAIFVISLGTSVRQAWAQEEDDPRFRKEELVQMLAPIALYPDSLIAQILMASTYPLEVVEAERWLRDNEALQGDALSEALREKPWDPSVKSLSHFPDVLFAMSENLDQTRKLGDAFLAQEQEVMDTVQELRQKAREQGNLKTTPEQKVIVEREIIRVEPASPQVVYVPVYDPYYVYGPWWYPAYPPYYWYYPSYPFVGGIHIGFGPRISIGLGLFSWVWFDWPVHRIYIDVPRTYHFHRYPVRPSYERHHWQHDPRHRRGVAYRDRRTGEHFGVPAPQHKSLQPGTRGYPAGTMERKAPAPAATAPAPDRKRERSIPRETQPEQRKIETAPSRGTPPSAPVQDRERTIAPERRPEPQRVAPVPLRVTPPPPPARERMPAPAESAEPERSPSSGRDTPFRGINEGSFERRAGERGEQSRRSGESRQQNDGGKRQDDDSKGRGGGQRR